MKMNEIFNHTFTVLRPVAKARVREMARRQLILHQEGPMVERHHSGSSMFCRAAVACGYLTPEQMRRAAMRYRLGMSRNGGVIFWQIGLLGEVFDGKIMYYRPDCHRDHSHSPTWVSNVLEHFYLTDTDIHLQTSHCLFGTHLLRGESGNCESPSHCCRITNSTEPSTTVAVVEAEKTAVIMSERFPEYLWLATGGLNELSPVKLFPLRGRKVILFPDTDPEGAAFRLWYDLAQKAANLLGQPVTVSTLLEEHATQQQKAAKIDLVDFMFER